MRWTLSLRSCELQTPTMDLKVTFHSPAKLGAGTQVRRERRAGQLGRYTAGPQQERDSQKRDFWEERVEFGEADQGMLRHPRTGNSGEPLPLPPKGQRDRRERASDRAAEDGSQPGALGRVEPALALPYHRGHPTRKGGGQSTESVGRGEALRPRVSPSAG